MTRGYGVFENFLAKKRTNITDRLIPVILRKGRLLDIGCSNYPYFLYNIDFAEKYGIDQNIDCSNNHVVGNINLQRFNIEKEGTIPFSDRYFDAVTMLAVCEHINPRTLPGIIKEVYRILKPGGNFIITSPASWTVFILSAMAKMRLVSPTEIKEHKCLYSRDAILDILSKNGFQTEKIRSGYFELFMNIWIKAEK